MALIFRPHTRTTRERLVVLPAAAATVAAVLSMGRPGGIVAVAIVAGAYLGTAVLLAGADSAWSWWWHRTRRGRRHVIPFLARSSARSEGASR